METLNWLQRTCTPYLFAVLPWSFRPRHDISSKTLRRTAYLDGLRGFAALIVYFGHHQLSAHAPSVLGYAFGYDGQFIFATFPVIRIFFTGGGLAVAVFFVISGYVLSAKPLGFIHTGKPLKLGDNIASALFRRWVRLFLPVIAVTFLFITILHAFDVWTSAMTREYTYWLELQHWCQEIASFTFVFGNSYFLPYNAYLWSIPIEFKGSIVIYITTMATSRLRRTSRLMVHLGLLVYFTWVVNGWYCAMFISGMMLCDWDLLALRNELPAFMVCFENFTRLKNCIYTSILIAGVYIGGVPELGDLDRSPGWMWLASLSPNRGSETRYFYLGWAAAFLVAACAHLRWPRLILESRVGQYLGRISYALYLIHGPILWTLGDRMYAATGLRPSARKHLPDWVDIFPITKAGPLGLEPAFILPQIFLFPLTLWLAEITTVCIDEASVTFVRWTYSFALLLDVD